MNCLVDYSFRTDRFIIHRLLIHQYTNRLAMIKTLNRTYNLYNLSIKYKISALLLYDNRLNNFYVKLLI